MSALFREQNNSRIPIFSFIQLNVRLFFVGVDPTHNKNVLFRFMPCKISPSSFYDLLVRTFESEKEGQYLAHVNKDDGQQMYENCWTKTKIKNISSQAHYY